MDQVPSSRRKFSRKVIFTVKADGRCSYLLASLHRSHLLKVQSNLGGGTPPRALNRDRDGCACLRRWARGSHAPLCARCPHHSRPHPRAIDGNDSSYGAIEEEAPGIVCLVLRFKLSLLGLSGLIVLIIYGHCHRLSRRLWLLMACTTLALWKQLHRLATYNKINKRIKHQWGRGY